MKKGFFAVCFLGFFPWLCFGKQSILFVGEGAKCDSAKESLEKIPSFEVISQKDISSILEEKKLQMLRDGKFEKWLPADFVLICEEIEGRVSYRMIDVLKGEVIKAESGLEHEAVKGDIETFLKGLFVEEKKPAEAGYVEVEVIGEARGKLEKGKEKEMERVLLMRAKRDAVEKAYGMNLTLESKKDFERVIAQSRAFLSYRILENTVNGDEGYVKISAVVSVPREVIERYGYKPKYEGKGVEEKFKEGLVNWTEGYIEAEGRVKKDGKPEEFLKRGAFVSASGNALKIISKMNLDGEKSVEEWMKENPDTVFVLKGLVKDAEIIKSGFDGDYYFVRIRVPFTGISGITSAFSSSIEYSPPRWVEKGEEDVVIVVDAVDLKVRPALFSNIKSENGERIHSASFVSPNVIKKEGTGKYLRDEREVGNKKKIKLKAISITGTNGADIVISAKDAEKIKEKGGKAINMGRVVIITGGRVGGTEG